MSLPEPTTRLGTINVRQFSSEINLTIVEKTKLVFSTAHQENIGTLLIPNEWTPMWTPMYEVSVPHFFFEILNYTTLFFLTVDDEKVLVGEVRMFVLFDKGAMQGKILIKENDGKFEFSLEDWNEISFIPQGISQEAELPMIIHNRDVWPIEGIDEENGGLIATLVELGDILLISMTKLVFDKGTPTHERWVVTIPRMSYWREVCSHKFEIVNCTDENMMASVIFQVEINDEWFPLQVTYQSQGDYIITDPTSLPLFATTTFTASLKTSSTKVVGEVYFLEELENGSSISQYVLGLPAPAL